jgi:hypothetical protein
MPTTAYTEVQIDDDSISLTLISEGQGGVRIEDTERYTFEELQSLSGEHDTLRLSPNTREELDEQARLAIVGSLSQVEQEPTLPEDGDVLTDENAPLWGGDWVEVVEVLSKVRADEYVIEGQHSGQALDKSLHTWTDKTVADANPSYDADEPVVIGQYEGTGKHYAFPESRLTHKGSA